LEAQVAGKPRFGFALQLDLERDLPNLDARKRKAGGASQPAARASGAERSGKHHAGAGTSGAGPRSCGCAAVRGDGPPRSGAAYPGDRGGGEEREPGAGAVGHGAQDAVERHGAADQGPDRPPRQGLGDARARAQGSHAAHQVPGARQEAPRDPHQEDQVRDAPRSPTLLPPDNEPFLYACSLLCNATFRDWF
jgi:hypothetical protein